MTALRTAALLAGAAALPGCLAIPYPVVPHVVPARIHDHAAPESPDLRAFRVGGTTREDVLFHLGEPEGVFDAERTFVYVGEDCRTGTLVAMGGPGGGATLGTEFGPQVALRIEFGPDGRVSAVSTFVQDVDGFETDLAFLVRAAGERP